MRSLTDTYQPRTFQTHMNLFFGGKRSENRVVFENMIFQCPKSLNFALVNGLII